MWFVPIACCFIVEDIKEDMEDFIDYQLNKKHSSTETVNGYINKLKIFARIIVL